MNTDYQQTQIGKFPKDWKVVRLIGLVENKSDIVAGPFGSNLKVCDYKPYGVPIIRLQNIERNRFVDKDIKYISQEKAEELRYHSYQPGDVVLAKLGDPIGKTCIVPSYMKAGVVVADVVRIRPSPKKAETLFLEYVLNSSICSYQLRKQTIGSTRPRVNISQVRNLKIPLPPLDEQRRVAEILSSVDHLIRRVVYSIAKTERLKKGLLNNLLTHGIDHKEFKYSKKLKKEIPDEWEIKTTKELFYIKGRIGWRGLKKAHYTDEGPYLITGWDFVDGKVDWDNCFHIPMDKFLESPEIVVQKNDILLTKDGTIGKVAYIHHVPGGKASLSSHLLLIRNLENNGVHPEYTYYLFQTRHFLDYVKRRQVGSTRSGLTQRAFEQFSFPLPPLEEQKKITQIVSTVDSKLELDRTRKEKLERIKRGLMNDLLTGKRRVKVAM